MQPDGDRASAVSRDPVAVLKFGGSVLRDDSSLPTAVHEVYRELRAGRRVVAVVSAFLGQTDRLLDRARSVSAEPMGTAMLCATGEAASVAMLALALDRAGVPAVPMPPSMVGVRTTGDLCDADPIELCVESTSRELGNAPVVVVPGFVGLSDDGHISLLGRGGSDLTALAFAHALNAEVCRLVKDVDGVYEEDPRTNPHARRYTRIPFEAAAAMGDVVVQPKARHFAIRHGREFELGRAGEPIWTHVGHVPEPEQSAPVQAVPLRVGMIGHGTVGAGVARRLGAAPDRFRVTGIGVRNTDRETLPEHASLLTTDLGRVCDECDLLIELAGGISTAGACIERALRRGADVVTANKSLIAAHGDRLRGLAAEHGASLRYAGAVGGGLPAIETVDRLTGVCAARGSGRITGLSGILNGTCNYVLDRLMDGAGFDEAVAEAQEAGFAEADPTLDLDGSDIASKLAILLTHATGSPFDEGSVRKDALLGMDLDRVEAARRAGLTLRLLGSATIDADGAHASVALREVEPDSVWGRARGAWNALEVTMDDGRREVVRGSGAGCWPTAESVMGDVYDVYRARHPAVATDGASGRCSATGVAAPA